MPGPLAPSKSYLIRIVDSSDEEDDSLLSDETETQTVAYTQNTISSLDETLEETSGKVPEVISADDSPILKNKRKRKKKKKQARKTGAAITIPVPRCTENLRVTFQSVSVYEFDRCMGVSVVPGDSGWPLGLSNEKVGDRADLMIDDFEVFKQKRLRERWNNLDEKPILRAGDLETRQWDYKRGPKNPLFTMFLEKERMYMLLTYSSCNTNDLDDITNHHSQFQIKSQQSCISDHSLKKSRSRSNSVSDNLKTRRESELFNDTYTQAFVHHVRNELEEIRIHRSTDQLGCSCRKLLVYLPPPDGGGKKAQHRRMHPRTVKDELRKRGLLPTEPRTREELEILLHETVEKEPCCARDCECNQNEIGCQADACSCWLPSHQTPNKKKPDSETLNKFSVDQIRSVCGNNMYCVDLDKISKYRTDFLASMTSCQVVTEETFEAAQTI
jgi:hypothetical protein